jgi:hypothetical protein
MLEFLAALDIVAGLLIGAVITAIIAAICCITGQSTAERNQWGYVVSKPKERPDAFVNRVCAVACVGVLSFAASHATFSPVRTETVTRDVVVNRNEAVPNGTITRAECARLRGRTFQQVIYDYGLPQDFDRTRFYFDSLHYSLGERNAADTDNNSKECNVYFFGGDGKITDKVSKVSIDV